MQFTYGVCRPARQARRDARQPRRGAFSFVELLVLVGILVILVSILLPYVSKVRETNRRTRCAENLYAIGLALTQYAKTNSLDYPRVRTATAPAPSTAPSATQPATTNPVTLGPAALAAQATPATSAPAPEPAPTTSPSPVATTAPATTAPAAPTPPPVPPAAPPAVPPPPKPPDVVVPGYVAFTGADSPNPFARDSQVQPNDVTASLWLLARSGLVQPYRFVCPSTGHTPDPMTTDGRWVAANQRSNFTGPQHLSYSYSSPFSASPRFRLNSDVLPSDFALLADKSPGIAGRDSDVTSPAHDARPLALARANSTNHNRAGQNVLYPTGTVQFQKTPYCGFGLEGERDNIYTALSQTPQLPQSNARLEKEKGFQGDPSGPLIEAKGHLRRDIGPAWEKDSYLVPAEGE